MEDIIIACLFVLLAGVITTYLRHQDYPASLWDAKTVLMTFFGAVISSGIAMWSLVELGHELLTLETLMFGVGAGVGGMTFVRVLSDKASKLMA